MSESQSNSTAAHVSQLKKALIRRREVERRTTLSRSSIYARLDAKSPSFDPEFPKPISLSPFSVAWVESEIDSWVLKRIETSRAPEIAEIRREKIMRRISGKSASCKPTPAKSAEVRK